MRRKAREELDRLEREGEVGIVLLGRPYHHDPGINQGIPEELQKRGYTIFSQSTLPLDEDLLQALFGDEVAEGVITHPLDISDVWKHTFSASSANKLWAAKFMARHPNLMAVELSNFKCGHDAPIYSTVEKIIEYSGTPYFAFKDIDENKPTGLHQVARRDHRLLPQGTQGQDSCRPRRTPPLQRRMTGMTGRRVGAASPHPDELHLGLAANRRIVPNPGPRRAAAAST